MKQIAILNRNQKHPTKKTICDDRFQTLLCLYRIRALSILLWIGRHMAALWRRLYIGTSSFVRYVTHTYVCYTRSRCIAFPRRRSAISRELPWRSFVAVHRRPRDALSGWHRRLRPEYFVREQGGIGLSLITRGHIRESRESTVYIYTSYWASL